MPTTPRPPKRYACLKNINYTRKYRADHYQLIPLQRVFEDMYGFSVQYKRMHMRLHPQLQATQHVANFVCEKDGSGGLLIVYYAGHGWAENNSIGRLSLSGRYPDAANEKDMSIEWTEVEQTLGKTASDVLVIFDCCHAGLLCRPAFRGPRRSFYYVAACKEDQVTRSSGEKSFTSAMIWALKELAHSPGFTVTRLVSTLMEHDKFPRDQQEAVVYPSRFGQGAQEIWIAPTHMKLAQVTSSPAQESPSGTKREDVKPTANILDLRLHFSDHAHPEHIEETARVLKDLLETRNSLRFHRITFIDHTSFVEWPARHWLNGYRRRASARNSGATAEHQSALENSKAAATSFDSRLLQLPGLQTSDSTPCSAMSTTAVGTPASGYRPWEKETVDEVLSVPNDQISAHLNIPLRLLVSCMAFFSICGGGMVEST